MKETKRNKANDMAAIKRRKLKQAAQHQSGDHFSEQIFAEVANKGTFGPLRMSHITSKEIRGKGCLAPRDTGGLVSPEGH